MAVNVAVSDWLTVLTITARDAVVMPSDQLVNTNAALGAASAVTLRPQSPAAVPAVRVAVPPVDGVAVSVSMHCCTKLGVTVDVGALTTSVSGFVVSPPVHEPKRYPAAGVAVSVTLRPQAPVSEPLVTAAEPPVAVPMMSVQVGAGTAKVAVALTAPVSLRTTQSATVTVHTPLQPANVLVPVDRAVRVTRVANGYVPLQLPAVVPAVIVQLIAGCEAATGAVTVPLPVPAPVTVSV